MTSCRLRRAACVISLLAVAACGSPDVAGMHIVLAEDGSAVLTTRSLLPQDEPGPVEGPSSGIDWNDRVRLVCSRGESAELASVRIDEIRFQPGSKRLRIEIPCGPEVGWVDRFAPAAEARVAAARTFDPRNPDTDVGSRITFEVEVPGAIVAAGAGPAFGVQSAHEKRSATLSITVRSVREQKRTIVWDITWK